MLPLSMSIYNGKLLMPVTVGGENCIKIYDVADDKGKYAGQSTGLIKSRLASESPFKKVVLIEVKTGLPIMVSK